jgi:CheY-like chemotaxis protein
VQQRGILVVDPDTDHRTRLRTLLAGNGSRVVGEATDPEEAMRQAVMTTPDVAVVAAALARGDGIHLAGRLVTEHGIPTVLLAPLVSLTSPGQPRRGEGFWSSRLRVRPGGSEIAVSGSGCQDARRRRWRMLESRKVIERPRPGDAGLSERGLRPAAQRVWTLRALGDAGDRRCVGSRSSLAIATQGGALRRMLESRKVIERAKPADGDAGAG